MDFRGLDDRARELEAMIRRIKDVISVRVMFSGEGLIEEIHVLASGGRNAKQLVRDVESALMAQGVSIDHKKISIAQLTPEEPPAAASDRVRIAGYSIGLNGRTAEAKVRLDWQGTACEGAAQGPATAQGRLKVVAEATLRALQQRVRMPSSLFLEDCALVKLGGREAVAVSVVELEGDRELGLVGSCLLGQDDVECVIKATLDALNRRISMLMSLTTT